MLSIEKTAPASWVAHTGAVATLIANGVKVRDPRTGHPVRMYKCECGERIWD